MQSWEQKRKRIALEEEVKELQQRLVEEVKLKSVLRYALKGPIVSCYPLTSFLPFKVQTLIVELEMLENEIAWLETKLRKLKIMLHTKKKLMNKEADLLHATKDFQMKLSCRHYKNQEQHKDALNHAMIFPKFMYVNDKKVILN
ncbi:hypothetical protein vseg_006603 [Gypsophila vaccaria]